MGKEGAGVRQAAKRMGEAAKGLGDRDKLCMQAARPISAEMGHFAR